MTKTHIIFSFVISFILFSCENTSNKLTEEDATQIIVDCQSRLNQSNIIYFGERGYFKDNVNSKKELSYMKRLHQQGYIKLDSLYTKDVGGRKQKIVSVYNVLLEDKIKPFILKQEKSNIIVKTLSIEIQDGLLLETINENKLKVIANYKKTKTPMYELDYDTSLLKDKPNIYSENSFLIKGNSGKWRCSSI